MYSLELDNEIVNALRVSNVGDPVISEAYHLRMLVTADRSKNVVDV